MRAGSIRVLVAAVALASPCTIQAAQLRAIRPVLTAESTRVVFELDAPTVYRLRVRAGSPTAMVPARLHIDLADTTLGPEAPTHLAPAGGPLVRWRSAELGGRVTRVILDVPGMSDYWVFSLPDPFRVVVVVHGTPRPVPVETAPPTTSAPPAALPPVPPPANRPAAPRTRPLTVVLDPGHGGKDPGASGVNGLLEKDLVIAVARALATRLRAEGYRVVLTRDRDVFLSLDERATRANTARADLFVSLHANASPNPETSGVETYYLSNSDDRATIRLAGMENHLERMAGRRVTAADVSWILSDMMQSYKVAESSRLARQIQDGVTGALRGSYQDVGDLGAKPGPFYVLVGAAMPAVLVELSFLSNGTDARRLAQPRYREALADGLLRGIQGFAERGIMATTL